MDHIVSTMDDIEMTSTNDRKRAREEDSDDEEDTRDRKMPRLAGVIVGSNFKSCAPYSRTEISWIPFIEAKYFLESPPQQYPFWQDGVGRSYRGMDWSITEAQQREWLATNPQWTNGLNGSWVGKRVLGRGGFGLVGLWEYYASDGDVRKVVVKQSKSKDRTLERESSLLQEFGKTGTRHMVRLLKRYHEEVGLGTSEWDSDKHCISRIYLEFCENGDMKGLIKRVSRYYEKRKEFIPEIYIWLIWECLARGLCVMQNGNEEVDGDVWDEPELVHFDIKPNNILIGGKDKEHTLVNVTKFADLGLSLPIPDALDDPKWLRRAERRGTPDWYAPEQVDPEVPNRMVGTPANVWCIARCMYILIRLGRTFTTDNYFKCYLADLNLNIETFGRKILRSEFDFYSDPLRVTLLRCLARDPTQRPTPRELLKQCQESLRAIQPEVAPFFGIPLEKPEANERGDLDAVADSAWFGSSSFLYSDLDEEEINEPAQKQEQEQDHEQPADRPINYPDEWVESPDYEDGA